MRLVAVWLLARTMACWMVDVGVALDLGVVCSFSSFSWSIIRVSFEVGDVNVAFESLRLRLRQPSGEGREASDSRAFLRCREELASSKT